MKPSTPQKVLLSTLLLSCMHVQFALGFGKGMSPMKEEERATLWVGHPDGSLQCETESGESLEQGAERLKALGVAVFAQRKQSDGKVRAQMCGMATGLWNVYEVSSQDWQRIKATLEFQVVPLAP